MPSYNYRCLSCNKRFTIFQGMHETALSICKFCNSNSIERLISGGSGLIFKGSGFYLTDYKNNKKSKKSAKKNDIKKTKSKE